MDGAVEGGKPVHDEGGADIAAVKQHLRAQFHGQGNGFLDILEVIV